MRKKLSEMCIDELWQLFPIILTEYQSCWKEWYAEEEKQIKEILQRDDARISHIGSTAIPGIWAKPIVDILLEVPKTAAMEQIKSILTNYGYICMSEADRRKSFNKGYTSEGFAKRVFHLHLRYYGDNHELYFRDYMNDNPSIAKEYEKLKRSLWEKYEHDRDAYTEAKTAFIEQYTECAKEQYRHRYVSF